MITTVFIECVSCGREKVLARHALTDAEAFRIARAAGWSVAGSYGSKRTRCGSCRRAGRRDTAAADAGVIGNRAGWQTPGRRRA